MRKKSEEMPTQVFVPLKQSPTKISLKFKFTIAVIISLIMVMAVGVWNLNKIQVQAFEKEARHRSQLVLNFGQASQDYVIKQLAPAVEKHTDKIIFEAQSNAFATRKIFEIFNQQLPEYIYRQPALNPMNNDNLADELESKIITYFQNNPDLAEQTGYQNNGEEKLFYIATPIKMETSCLQCHGKPEDAPPEIIDKYGKENGFNWQVGEVISTLMIYVPTKDLLANQASLIHAVIFIFICLTIVLISVIYFLFDKLVGTRINQVSQAMTQAALHPGVTVRIHDQGKDELGRMAKIFNRMADSLDDAYASLEHKVAARTAEIEKTLQELKVTQSQLIQAEKMSSLGQLVAGIAHEINNPLSFISGNIKHAENYTQDLLKLIEIFQSTYPLPDEKIKKYLQEIDLAFISEDLPKLLKSMKIGSDRIDQIVLNLRNFSRLDQADMKYVDLHEGIESTLVILQHRLKENSQHPEIIILREYSRLPLVECNPGLLNQVFMNLLSNAIDELISHFEELTNTQNKDPFIPEILIKTEVVNSQFAQISISDNGSGMIEQVRSQIFNPFFTTKPIGKGTGLGLSISYKIIVERHQGKISCASELGKGTTFSMEIPIQQNKSVNSYQ
jgi:signal transduction histidine kinase